MTSSFDRVRRCSLAVDLGSARTRVYEKQVGLVVDEPSIAAVNSRTGGLVAAGVLAERMAGRTPPHIRIVHPIQGGTVVDTFVAQMSLRRFVGRGPGKPWHLRPSIRAAACLPHDSSPLARRATLETLSGIGARHIEIVDSVMAAALGCGLPVEQPEAVMIVICGAAITQIAVLSLGEVVTAATVPTGGDAAELMVAQYLRTRHGLVLPRHTLSSLHHTLGVAGPSRPDTEVYGKDIRSGLTRTLSVDSEELRNAMQAPLLSIVDGITGVLRRCPPDLVLDLAERGIVLVGGSATLPGLDGMLRNGTEMPVHIPDDPELCTVNGLGLLIEGVGGHTPRPQPEPEPQPQPQSQSQPEPQPYTQTAGTLAAESPAE